MKVDRFLLSLEFGMRNRCVRSILEAEAIFDIPLSRRGCADLTYWNGCKNEKYYVKLCYMRETKCLDPPPFQSLQPNHSWWKTLWNLNIPLKIRIFLWRASKDFIPTIVNLSNHHVLISGICSLCKFQYASTSHCLIICPVINQVWRNSSFWFRLKNHSAASFFDRAFYLAKFVN